jgi:formylglycine-generating enzyme required for sulfatase activity
VSPYGWHGDNSHGKSRDVGLKEPNAWGLFDMHGNVWEWCADPYVEAQAPQDVREEKRVIRGGSWRDPVGDCRAAARRGLKSTETKSSVGFRVVRTVAGAAPAAISTSTPPGNR